MEMSIRSLKGQKEQNIFIVLYTTMKFGMIARASAAVEVALLLSWMATDLVAK